MMKGRIVTTVRASAAARFQREVVAHGKLDHPNVVRATDAREVDGVAFLVMDLVDGIDLDRLVRESGQLPIADACELARQTTINRSHWWSRSRRGKAAPVALSFDKALTTRQRTQVIAGVMPVGAGMDVFWSNDTLFVMKEKGKLRHVWHGPGLNDGMYGFSTVTFDGKYIWATLPQPRANAILLVLDPKTEKV